MGFGETSAFSLTSFLNFCGSKYHGILAQKTVGYPYSRDPPDSRIGVPMFCHCQSKGIVNISITWSSRATMQQSTQSEDDCSLVFLHNLHRTKVIKLLYHCRAWQDYENDMILKWSSLLGFRLLKLNLTSNKWELCAHRAKFQKYEQGNIGLQFWC